MLTMGGGGQKLFILVGAGGSGAMREVFWWIE